MYKVDYPGPDGKSKIVEHPGLLEALEFVVSSGVRGAKVQTPESEEWNNADELLIGFRKLFEPAE